MDIIIGSRVRDKKTGLIGKVFRIYGDRVIPGPLFLIKLDQEDPLFGSVLTAYEDEIEAEKERRSEGAL